MRSFERGLLLLWVLGSILNLCEVTLHPTTPLKNALQNIRTRHSGEKGEKKEVGGGTANFLLNVASNKSARPEN